MNQQKIKHLVLSGGGLLGISYIGLFKYFEEHNTLSDIKTITGCSAGAIFGSLLSIGYTYKELDTIVKSMVFKDYLKINVDSLLNFIHTKGFESGKNLGTFIKNSIKEKTGDETITFSQIQEKYNIKLQIGVTNLTKSKFELFNVDTTPDIPIIKAISASIAIPFIFEPIVIGDDIYCDGGLLDNLPMPDIVFQKSRTKKEDLETPARKAAFKKSRAKNDEEKEDLDNTDNDTNSVDDIKEVDDDKEDSLEDSLDDSESTIGFYLINKSNNINKDNYKTISLSQYINVITHTLSQNLINTKFKQVKNSNYKIIKIEIPCDIMTFIKLNATHDDINNIIDIAYTITHKFYQNLT
jgi:predicted acylesterase/phospholipase RssA